ncbi:MAG: hypothetical protein HQK51_10210 [Oligoflexia bacterium]|nr:hypothetical protein [Oligoflexia bacterium]
MPGDVVLISKLSKRKDNKGKKDHKNERSIASVEKQKILPGHLAILSANEKNAVMVNENTVEGKAFKNLPHLSFQ